MKRVIVPLAAVSALVGGAAWPQSYPVHSLRLVVAFPAGGPIDIVARLMTPILVVQTDFLERRLFARLRDALRRGGLLLLDTFLDQGRPNAEGPSRTEFLLAAGELPRSFPDFEVLRYEEQAGDSARAVFLARKS